MQQQLASPQLTPIPSEVESPSAKLVYLYLSAVGGATVTEAKRELAMKQITLLSVINTLTEKGLIERNGRELNVRME